MSPAASLSLLIALLLLCVVIGWCCCRVSALSEPDRHARQMQALRRVTGKDET